VGGNCLVSVYNRLASIINRLVCYYELSLQSRNILLLQDSSAFLKHVSSPANLHAFLMTESCKPSKVKANKSEVHLIDFFSSEKLEFVEVVHYRSFDIYNYRVYSHIDI